MTLHVFYNDDSEEYWVAAGMDDLKAQQLELDPESWEPDDWGELDDATPKAILFVDDPEKPGQVCRASDDDDPEDCVKVTKTFAEWAADGRGYLCTTEI